MDDNVIAELNRLSEDLGVKNRISFHAGSTAEVVAKTAPFGRVAVLYTKTGFLKKGSLFTLALKNAGLKPLNFIMPDNASLNTENVFDVIGVPENVRAVVYRERELSQLAAYLATVFSVPAICALETVYTDGMLCAKTSFFWDKNSELFPTNCVYRIVIGNVADAPCDEAAAEYAALMEKIAALTDYRVRLAVLGEKAAKKEYSVIKNAILKAFASPDKNTLLLAGLKAETANFACGGAIVTNSAEYSFKRLTGFKTDADTNFLFFEKLLRLYALCAEENSDPFVLPDHNERAASLSKTTGADEGLYLKGFLTQINALKKCAQDRIKSGFKDELNAQLKAFSEIKRTYLSLGNRSELPPVDFSPYVPALFHCGDLPDTMNFMTLVRESGLTEHIKRP